MQEQSSTHHEALEGDLEAALQNSLRRLRVPPISAAFDERVLASLAQAETGGSLSGWVAALRQTARAWWSGPSLQMMLSGAACAAILTLGAYSWSVNTPISSPEVKPAGAGVAASRFPDFLEIESSAMETGSYRGLLLGAPPAISRSSEPLKAKPRL